jgi:hypothetical protein
MLAHAHLSHRVTRSKEQQNLALDVIERIWGVYSKADKNYVRVLIVKMEQAIEIVFLAVFATKIPEFELDTYTIHRNIEETVLNDVWNIRELYPTDSQHMDRNLARSRWEMLHSDELEDYVNCGAGKRNWEQV